MNDPLLGPRIKLERAYHHLIELERTEGEFFQKNPCRIVFDTETQAGHKLVKIVLDAQPPEIVHVLAGEIIYQLRSALDQTAVAFARLSKGPTKPKTVYFPTGDGPKGFISACRGQFKSTKNTPFFAGLRYFDSDLRKAIMRTKPYNGGNDLLRAIFPMAQIDKHMELIAVGAVGAMTFMRHFTVHKAFTGIILDGPGDLNKGVIIADIHPDGRITPSHPEAQINVSRAITLGDVGPAYSGKPLVPFLRGMIEELGRAQLHFEDALIARGDMQRPRLDSVSRVV